MWRTEWPERRKYGWNFGHRWLPYRRELSPTLEYNPTQSTKVRFTIFLVFMHSKNGQILMKTHLNLNKTAPKNPFWKKEPRGSIRVGTVGLNPSSKKQFTQRFGLDLNPGSSALDADTQPLHHWDKRMWVKKTSVHKPITIKSMSLINRIFLLQIL